MSGRQLRTSATTSDGDGVRRSSWHYSHVRNAYLFFDTFMHITSYLP